MWKQLLDLGKQYIGLARKVDQHDLDIKDMRQGLNDVRRDIKDLREEVRALALLIREAQWERKYDRDMAVRDRENPILQLKVDLLSSGRSLPPPESDEKGF